MAIKLPPSKTQMTLNMRSTLDWFWGKVCGSYFPPHHCFCHINHEVYNTAMSYLPLSVPELKSTLSDYMAQSCCNQDVDDTDLLSRLLWALSLHRGCGSDLETAHLSWQQPKKEILTFKQIQIQKKREHDMAGITYWFDIIINPSAPDLWRDKNKCNGQGEPGDILEELWGVQLPFLSSRRCCRYVCVKQQRLWPWTTWADENGHPSQASARLSCWVSNTQNNVHARQ